MSGERQPLLVDLRIPYCVREEPFSRRGRRVGSNAEKDAYMAALKRELLSWEGELEGYEVPALRLSGGSATVMDPDLLGDLLRTAREILPLTPDAELGVDAEPVTVGTPSLTGLSAGRPNRLELMMRSFSDEELAALGCAHTVQQFQNAFLFVRRFRMNNFGFTVDLGIPGQTPVSFRNTLHACTIFRPAHIRIQTPEVRDAEGMPDEEARFGMYRDGCAFLEKNGYRQYAAGDFCLPQHECRAALAELDAAPVLGLGLGAVTVLDGYLTRSTNNLSLYLENAGDWEKATAEVFAAGEDWAVRDYAGKRLRAVDGLSRSAFEARFGRPLPEDLLAELSERQTRGLLTVTEDGFVPTRRGLFSTL